MVRILHLSEIDKIARRVDWTDIPDFVYPVIRAGSGPMLVDVVSTILKKIGFDAFYFLATSCNGADQKMALVTNLALTWVAKYSRLNHFESDPHFANCLSHATPMLWDVKRRYPSDGNVFLDEATRYGFRSGIALPVGDNAMFGVCSSSESLPDEQELQLAIGRLFLFASYFHEHCAHLLRGEIGDTDSAVPSVTKREREVLELAAHGESSKRIAYQLGISESTANFHIASVKRKFNARTRAQAIAHAVHTGLIR